MLEEMLSKAGKAIWLCLSLSVYALLFYAAEVRHEGPIAWLKDAGWLNKLTLFLVLVPSGLLCWPVALLWDRVTRQGMFGKADDDAFSKERGR